jgi:cAMP-dependent protein kinase regulator
METSRIAAFPVFADLPEAELDELAGAVHELAVAERSTVVNVDDYGDAVYLVEEGTADVMNERGETTQTLTAGDTFGEIGLLLTGQRTATVVARGPLKLLSLSGADFERIRSRVPELEQTLRRLGLERASR